MNGPTVEVHTFKDDHRNQEVREVLSRLKNTRINASFPPAERIEFVQNLQTIEACFEANRDLNRSLRNQVNELRETVLAKESEIINLKQNLEQLGIEKAEVVRKLDFLIKGTSDRVLKPLMESYRNVRLMVSNEIKAQTSNEYCRKEGEMSLSACKDIMIYYGGKPVPARYCGKLEKGKPSGSGKLMIDDKIILANFNEIYSEDDPIWKTKPDSTGNNNATIYYQNGDIYIGTIRCSKNQFSREKGTLQVLGENSQYTMLKGEWDHKDLPKQTKPSQLQAYFQTV